MLLIPDKLFFECYSPNWLSSSDCLRDSHVISHIQDVLKPFIWMMVGSTLTKERPLFSLPLVTQF